MRVGQKVFPTKCLSVLGTYFLLRLASVTFIKSYYTEIVKNFMSYIGKARGSSHHISIISILHSLICVL